MSIHIIFYIILLLFVCLSSPSFSYHLNMRSALKEHVLRSELLGVERIREVNLPVPPVRSVACHGMPGMAQLSLDPGFSCFSLPVWSLLRLCEAMGTPRGRHPMVRSGSDRIWHFTGPSRTIQDHLVISHSFCHVSNRPFSNKSPHRLVASASAISSSPHFTTQRHISTSQHTGPWPPVAAWTPEINAKFAKWNVMCTVTLREP